VETVSPFELLASVVACLVFVVALAWFIYTLIFGPSCPNCRRGRIRFDREASGCCDACGWRP
jgi:hypothetical protein